jgi:small subunit ribosomal protein S18
MADEGVSKENTDNRSTGNESAGRSGDSNRGGDNRSGDNRSGDNRDYRGGRDNRDNREGGGRPYRGRRPFFKKKVCRFCTQDIVADYKNPDLLRRFVTERGKILPRRITGTCAKHQRSLSREIKRARVLAYLPFVKK